MMWWHKVFHRVAEVRYVSSLHPVGWVCSCGKEWKP